MVQRCGDHIKRKSGRAQLVHPNQGLAFSFKRPERLSALAAAGCERIYREKASGGRWDRPELHKTGRMVPQMLAAFSEFERAMLRERTKAGLESARQEGRIGGCRPKLTVSQRQEILRLIKAGSKTAADAHDSEEADEDDPRYIRLNQLASAIAQIEDKRKEDYPPEAKALSGVVVAIDWNGNAHYTYGLPKREDEVALAQPPDESAATTTTTSSAVEPAIEETEGAYSAPLVEKLTQHKTAAIAAELMQQPKIALAALVHGLVLSGFGLDLQLYRSETCIQISTTEPHLEAAETGPAFTMLQEQRQAWLAQFPKNSGELWYWCLEQTQDTLLRLLAFCAAMTLNAVQTKAESPTHSPPP